MTHCPKLHAAYAAMLVELLGRGAVPIVFCTERAREFGISERTLFKARSKLPMKVVHVPCTGGRPYWELANGYHGKRFTCETDAPSWRPPRPARPCADCGEPMHGAHWHARRCTGCQATRSMVLLQDLRRDTPLNMTHPIGQKPDGSKADRIVAQSAKIEAGHVHLPKDAEWLDSFLLELLAFPHGRHDDQVDSVSQFLGWAATRKSLEPDIGLPISTGNYHEHAFRLM